jgi:hypothetical protein
LQEFFKNLNIWWNTSWNSKPHIKLKTISFGLIILPVNYKHEKSPYHISKNSTFRTVKLSSVAIYHVHNYKKLDTIFIISQTVSLLATIKPHQQNIINLILIALYLNIPLAPFCSIKMIMKKVKMKHCGIAENSNINKIGNSINIIT